MRTFSGTHEFDSTVLIGIDDDGGDAGLIAENIEDGRCPRCENALPTPPELPAGSRVTPCRSIPVCGPCGSDEAYEVELDGALSGPSCWPIDRDEIDARRQHMQERSVSAVLMASPTGAALITDDGVSRVIEREHPGGWLEFPTQAEVV